jgi:hypothetical protein
MTRARGLVQDAGVSKNDRNPLMFERKPYPTTCPVLFIA